jgi:hypothetical protein
VERDTVVEEGVFLGADRLRRQVEDAGVDRSVVHRVSPPGPARGSTAGEAASIPFDIGLRSGVAEPASHCP